MIYKKHGTVSIITSVPEVLHLQFDFDCCGDIASVLNKHIFKGNVILAVTLNYFFFGGQKDQVSIDVPYFLRYRTVKVLGYPQGFAY